MLSVIVPITSMAGRLHNLRAWLPKEYDPELEIHLVHDYRDQETESELVAIVENLGNTNVFLHSGKYGSPGGTRNYGLKHAVGDYVCFWDADDLPVLSSVLGKLKNVDNKTDMIIGQFIIVDDKKRNTPRRREIDCNLNDMAFHPGIWRIIFKKSLIDSLEFTNLMMAEDQIYLAECLKKLPNVVYTNNVFYNYFTNINGQLTKNVNAKADLVNSTEIMKKMSIGTEKFEQKPLAIMFFRQQLAFTKLHVIKGSFYILKSLVNPAMRNCSFSNYLFSMFFSFSKILGEKVYEKR
jgi:glycosyltransferase involved in cell wall biosynthesis